MNKLDLNSLTKERGIKCIKDLKLGDKVITLDASGKEIIGVVTEVMQPAEEEIVEVAFSDGTLWHTTESQTLYLAHNQHCMVKFAKGKKALLRDGGTVTVLDVKYTGKRETVYDVLLAQGGCRRCYGRSVYCAAEKFTVL